MQISFTKMHGLGNDFAVICHQDTSIDSKKFPISQWADRHFGIGFDQLLVIEPGSQADFFCRIYNADGSEAEQCGNGLRCVARYIHEEKLTAQNHFSIATVAGVFPIMIEDYERIHVTLAAPTLTEPQTELILANDQRVMLTALSTGNPHAILQVESVEHAPIATLGAALSTHTHFPHGTNVGFMEIVDVHHIRLRTFERGAGETLACGSNACAAVFAGIANKWLHSRVRVEFQHGSLWIEWHPEQHTITMIGPATRVFAGKVDW